MQWYRQYAEFATDPKVQMMSEVDQRRLVILYCLRCQNPKPFSDQELAFHMRIDETSWNNTKSVYIQNNFINSKNEILNWNKRQYKSDSSTERVKRFRQRSETVTETPPETEQNRTEQNRAEQNREREARNVLSLSDFCLGFFKDEEREKFLNEPTEIIPDDFGDLWVKHKGKDLDLMFKCWVKFYSHHTSNNYKYQNRDDWLSLWTIWLTNERTNGIRK